MRWGVTNRPFGHRLASSTRIFPPPSFTRRVAHGSGTQAPSIWPCWNDVSVTALSCGTTETSPPPDVSVVKPFVFSHERSAMSCVLPSCGLAIFLPARSAGFVIDGLTTRNAPPDAAPDTILMACLFDFWNALIDGPGPMNDASSAPEKIAVVTSGPALNDCGL